MSLFANAKTVAPKVSAKGKPKKEEIKIDKLEKLAEIGALIKSLESIQETLESEVKEEAKAIFLKEASKTGKRPENFTGIEGKATASVELRKRGTNSVLTDEEVEVFNEDKIPFETISDISETFIINPAYASDSELLGKIEKSLKRIKELPEDFILKQEGKSRRVVTAETLDVVFERKLAAKFIDNVCLVAVKPKLDVTDFGAILKKLAASDFLK